MADLDRNQTSMVLLAVLTLIAMGFVLQFAQSVIIPLLVAWLLSQILGPLMMYLVHMKIPSMLAIGLVLILLLAIVYWIGFFVSASASSLIEQLPEYKTRMTAVTEKLLNHISDRIGGLSDEELKKHINNQIVQLFGSLMGFVGSMVGRITNLAAKLVMIFVILAFMLLGKAYNETKIRRAFTPRLANQIIKISGSISSQISRYLIVQFLISLVTGVLVWITCEIIGIGSALTWGALAFFLNFIPTFGSIIATIPPILLALLQFYPSYWPALIALIVLMSIQQLMGNIITPKAMGDRLNLSPVVILLSLLFWGWLWGVVGALLSVLIAASMKIVCDNIEVLQPIGILMGSGKVYQTVSRESHD